MVIGVLAVQGAFIEHEKMLEALGATTFEIRQKKDLEQHMDGFESNDRGRIASIWNVRRHDPSGR